MAKRKKLSQPVAAKWSQRVATQIKGWGRRLTRLGGDLARAEGADAHEAMPLGQKGGIGISTLLGLLDWDQISAEVQRESRAQIVIAGTDGCGKTTLLHTLRGTAATCAAHDADAGDSFFGATPATPIASAVEDLGLFLIATVPEQGVSAHAGIALADWLPLDGADLLIWVLDGETGLRAGEYEWLCRARATGRPLLLVLNKCDAVRVRLDDLSQQLAGPLLPISARTGEGIADKLLPAMVDACPPLTTALGREVPAWRSTAVQRASQRAAMLSGLAGVEPVPLLDLPFQMLIQLRLVLRVAAVYGEPVGDRYSRELLATLIGGAGLRYVGQQLAKVVPVVGWAASGALAAAGTYAIGKLARTYFEHGRRLPTPNLKPLGVKRRRVAHGGAQGAAQGAAQDAASPVTPETPNDDKHDEDNLHR